MDLLKSLLELIIAIFIKKQSDPVIASSIIEEPVKSKGLEFILTRTVFSSDGIFGELKSDNEEHICYTLEHSYDNKPKLADGFYNCVRGPHRLHNMTEDFITFEIKGIPDFNGKSVTGILFHWGNYNEDSDGCVLMGSTQTPTMIGASRDMFAHFMKIVEGLDTFRLTVKSVQSS